MKAYPIRSTRDDCPGARSTVPLEKSSFGVAATPEAVADSELDEGKEPLDELDEANHNQEDDEVVCFRHC